MLLSENDWHVLYRDSIFRVADLLNIRQPDDTPESLIESIQDSDHEAFDLLNQFLSAWRAWFEFHRRVDVTGAAGHLSGAQYQELITLARDRDTKRTALVRKAKQLELRRVTIRIPPDVTRPGRELEVAARIRRDLYAHGPIEIDPDDPQSSTRRDHDRWASFSFITAHEQAVREILQRFGHEKANIQIQAIEAAEPCLNCGSIHHPILPTVCEKCGFRDISPCPKCGEEIPRASYIKVSGNLHRCPTCTTRVRLHFNEPLFEPSGQHAEPIVLVEEAT